MSTRLLERLTRRPVATALIAAALAYGASLALLLRTPGQSLVEPLFLLAFLGGVFPLLAWLMTRRPRDRGAVHEPAPDWRGVTAYLAVFALVVLGFGFSFVNATFPDEPAQSIAQLGVKLVTMVVLPAALFLGWRFTARPRFARRRLVVVFALMAVAWLAFQAVFGRGLVTLAELAPSAATLAWAIPACWLWQTLEAGLCEEFLFRRVTQESFARATGSDVAAIVWASLVFGLAHAPGLWLRGAHLMEGVEVATPLWAIAYSIVMIAPAGVAFGVLWARTRSLALVVAVHGTVDLIPQLAPFIRAWT